MVKKRRETCPRCAQKWGLQEGQTLSAAPWPSTFHRHRLCREESPRGISLQLNGQIKKKNLFLSFIPLGLNKFLVSMFLFKNVFPSSFIEIKLTHGPA